MTKLQWAVIAAAIALFFVLYFGCERTPPDIATAAKSRGLSAESTTPEAIKSAAMAELAPAQASNVMALEEQLSEAVPDSMRAEVLKLLSREWYQLQQPALSGYYAQQVAELQNTAESWSIAGTTYSICLQRAEEEKIRDFCTGRAVRAFENAISLEPENVANQVNLALTYTSNPPPDNPMKGVLMLRQLNQEAPDNVLVLNALARLAIQTGQYDKAVERLTAALEVAPDNVKSTCLLAQAYEGQGNAAQAEQYADRCRAMTQQAPQ